MSNTQEMKKEYGEIWFDGKKINEAVFCSEFVKDFPMICINDSFFTVDGMVRDESGLRREIYNCIKPYITTGISKKITNLMDVLKLECAAQHLPIYHDRIHVRNGTYFLNGEFTETKTFCRNRLPVAYNPGAPKPETWLRFLSELLNDEDIPTLQEFMGYCLIPSTKGQKMLILTGKGGEGKSRIGLVMKSLLGANMNTGSIAKVETNQFARADLEHELVLLDDDMKLEALPQTNYIKAIVTAELPMDLDKKSEQSFQGDLYVRFIALGNGTLISLYDRSVGFFRRQIILNTKDKNPNRKDDPYIGEKMCAEAEGIFLWALEGLKRLIQNDYKFTVSEAARANMEAAVADGNNVIEFLASDSYIEFSQDSVSSSKELYATYKMWCEDNALPALAQKTFCSYLKQNERKYCIRYTNKVSIGNGKYVRGFAGIRILQHSYF